MNPNLRMVNNRFAAQLAENEALHKYVGERKTVMGVMIWIS